MSEILVENLGEDYWATSADVQDEFQIQTQNEDPDFDRRIQQATRRMQARYEEAAGKDAPADPPPLLRDATALLAASLAHQAFAANIQSSNGEDERQVFLEDSAWDTFDDWKRGADLDPGSESQGEASANIGGLSGTISGDDPIYRGGP